MFGLCQACKYWNPEEPEGHSGLDAKECHNPKLRAIPYAEPGDLWGKTSGIGTARDFGCVQFELRMPQLGETLISAQ